MKIIAVIPARGGSKGIPLKNIQPIGGTPLVARSINAAKKSKFIDEIFVSTDSDLISDVAIKAGAQVIRRPDNISGDTASSESALLNTLSKVPHKSDYIVFLQCTSPFTESEHIDSCIKKILEAKADSCFATVSNHRFLWRANATSGVAEGVNHDGKNRKRRQDLAPEFMETGAVYVMKTSRFLEEKTRFCGKIVNCNFDDESLAFEIDSPFDLAIARAIEQSKPEKKVNFEKIKLVVSDFDGVFTDNKVYLDENGKESARCDRGDGMGVSLLKKKGIPIVILSTEKNPIVQKRAEKLGIPAFFNIQNKVKFLESYLRDLKLTFEEVCYLGNDINDLECLKLVGLPVVPADAHESVKSLGQIHLTRNGGEGAVREFCDLFLKGIQHE